MHDGRHAELRSRRHPGPAPGRLTPTWRTPLPIAAAVVAALALAASACGPSSNTSSIGSPTSSGAPATATTTLASDRVERVVTVGSQFPLTGTLTLPKGAGPFPAVVLVHGSGPLDQDETVGAIKPFRDLAHGLAAAGVATLRYHKRTLAYPRAFVNQTYTVNEEAVEDAQLAVALLRSTPEIDPGRVFVLGHSLGAFLAGRIGQGHPEIAGFVLVAGPTRPFDVVARAQSDYLVSLNRAPISAADEEKRQAELEKWRRAVDPNLSPDTPLADLPGFSPPSYWLDLQGYDPVAAEAALGRPLLVLQGGRDYQVTMEDFAGYQRALAGRPDVRLISYPGLNHLLVAGEGQSTPAEYQRPGNVDPKLIADVAAFVLDPPP